MLRRTVTVGLAIILALAACKPGAKKNPVIAKGRGVTITAQEFKARLDEQSPFIRARYSTLERKKEFLDNLIRFEVLAKEAEKRGLARDPDVLQTMKKVMVQKLVQKNFQDLSGAKDMPEADQQKYYDEHKDEFQRPRKLRLSAIVFNAPEGSADRAKKTATAKKALAKIKADEKKNPAAFSQALAELTEDAASKAVGGDLGFKTKEEMEKTYGPAFAEAAATLKDGEMSGIVATDKALYIVKETGHQDEVNRTFDQVRAQIANKLFREKKTKEYEEWLKHLREDAKVTVDDKALDEIQVAAGPGMPPGGMPMGGMPMGAMPMRPMPPGATAMPPPMSAPPPTSAPPPAPAPVAPATR